MSSRRQKRKKQKRGNAGFFAGVTIVFLIVLAGATGTWLWMNGTFAESEFMQSVSSFMSSKQFKGEEPPPMDLVYVVGDSITVGADEELRKQIIGAVVDAEVGRTMPTGLEILTKLKEDGLPLDYVVIGLANNPHPDEIESIREILDMLANQSVRIVFVTGHGRSYMKAGNEFIRALPEEYSNVFVADWDKAISEHEDWLGGDGIHVSNKRANALYAQLVSSALTRQ